MEKLEQNDELGKKLEEFSSEVQKYLEENDNADLSKLKQLHEEFISAATKTKKEKEEEANKAQAELKEAIKKTEESVDNINEGILTTFKNTNKPSRNNFLVFKLMFLLFNPEANMPSDDIKKELFNIKNRCLMVSSKDIKHVMKKILQDINWITPEFLRKVRMFREYPYTDPKAMESISTGAKYITVYFQNLMKYKELYDKVNRKEEPAKNKLAEIKVIIETEINKNKKSLKELDDSKKEAEKEKNSLLAKLSSCEKLLGLITFINDCLQKNKE